MSSIALRSRGQANRPAAFRAPIHSARSCSAERFTVPPRATRTCPRRTLEWKSAAAAENYFETRGERASAERLGEKVVGAELEDAYFVVLVALRGQHDDGNVCGGRARAQVRQHAIAVQAREVQVEHDDVGPHAIDLIERLHAVAGLGHDVAVPLEQVAHHLAQAVLVVHEQDFRRRLAVRAGATGGRRLFLEQIEVRGDGRSRLERSEEHTSELQSPCNLVCRLLLEKKKNSTSARRETQKTW